jgi:hypothetical protein
MKLTKSKLKQLIKEEAQTLLQENPYKQAISTSLTQAIQNIKKGKTDLAIKLIEGAILGLKSL